MPVSSEYISGGVVKKLVRALRERGYTIERLTPEAKRAGATLSVDDVVQLMNEERMRPLVLMQASRGLCTLAGIAHASIVDQVAEVVAPVADELLRRVVAFCVKHGWGEQTLAHSLADGTDPKTVQRNVAALFAGKRLARSLGTPLANLTGIPATLIHGAHAVASSRQRYPTVDRGLPLNAIIAQFLCEHRRPSSATGHRTDKRQGGGISALEFATRYGFSSRRISDLLNGKQLASRPDFWERLASALKADPATISPAARHNQPVARFVPGLVAVLRTWIDTHPEIQGVMSKAGKIIGVHPETLGRFLDDGDILAMQAVKRERLRRVLNIDVLRFYAGIAEGGEFTHGATVVRSRSRTRSVVNRQSLVVGDDEAQVVKLWNGLEGRRSAAAIRRSVLDVLLGDEDEQAAALLILWRRTKQRPDGDAVRERVLAQLNARKSSNV
jgi:hypothetical protein